MSRDCSEYDLAKPEIRTGDSFVMNKYYNDSTVLSSWAKEALDSMEEQENTPKPKQFLYHAPDWMAGMMSDEQMQIMAQQKMGELQPLVDMLEGCSIKSIVNAAYEMFGEEVSGFVKLCVSHQAGMDESEVAMAKEPHESVTPEVEDPEQAPGGHNYMEQGSIESLIDDDGKPDTPALPQNGQ